MDIVIVDDQPSARTMLRHIVQDIGPQLDVHDFGEPDAALAWCNDNRPDLLLLDYRMPGMDGLELAKAFRRPLRNRDVPIVLVTVVGDEPVRQAALDAGVIDFLVKPIRPRELRARCRNLLQLRQQSESVKQRALSLEQRLLASMHEVEERERETLSRLARAIEYRDAGTSAFLERMAHVAGLIADELGLPSEDVRTIEMAAPLHDIGKIAIPDHILLKPGRHTPEEFAIMQTHSVKGESMLLRSLHEMGGDNAMLRFACQIARSHHERWDGGGYPDGLAGEAIPLAARLMAVADVYDALRSRRPYKKAFDHAEAVDIIVQGKGSHFDPLLVEAFLALQGVFSEIATKLADE